MKTLILNTALTLAFSSLASYQAHAAEEVVMPKAVARSIKQLLSDKFPNSDHDPRYYYTLCNLTPDEKKYLLKQEDPSHKLSPNNINALESKLKFGGLDLHTNAEIMNGWNSGLCNDIRQITDQPAEQLKTEPLSRDQASCLIDTKEIDSLRSNSVSSSAKESIFRKYNLWDDKNSAPVLRIDILTKNWNSGICKDIRAKNGVGQQASEINLQVRRAAQGPSVPMALDPHYSSKPLLQGPQYEELLPDNYVNDDKSQAQSGNQ